MPTMASMTVKKFDGVTDIIYDQLTPSGGDGVPAVWRQDTGALATLPNMMRASLQLFTKNNGKGNARQSNFLYRMPFAVLDTTTGLYTSPAAFQASGIVTLPSNMPVTVSNEASYQFCHLMAHLLVKQQFASGYAAR